MYQIWDDELNVLWSYLIDSLSVEEMDELIQEELGWIAYTDAKVTAAGEFYGNGSMRSMEEAITAKDLTKNSL